jgi:hypothetical protein
MMEHICFTWYLIKWLVHIFVRFPTRGVTCPQRQFRRSLFLYACFIAVIIVLQLPHATESVLAYFTSLWKQACEITVLSKCVYVCMPAFKPRARFSRNLVWAVFLLEDTPNHLAFLISSMTINMADARTCDDSITLNIGF